MDVQVESAAFDELEPRTAYGLWRLRGDVFVVEQTCAYPELDGRDVEPATRHLWIQLAEVPVAYLRVLEDPEAVMRIGRVCVRRQDRSTGLAAALVRAALAEIGDRVSVLDAQSPLVPWYARFGYAVDGPEFVEDGIAHVPMRRVVRPARRP